MLEVAVLKLLLVGDEIVQTSGSSDNLRKRTVVLLKEREHLVAFLLGLAGYVC